MRPSDSGDHIFPEFLGGRRKVAACRTCNSTFGHTFEAESAKILQPIYISIATWGVPVQPLACVWQKAFTQGGKTYDLIMDASGVTPELSRAVPHITFDESGDIVSREFRGTDRTRATKFGRQIVAAGAAKDVEIVNTPPQPLDLHGLELKLEIGPALKRTAIKIACALASLLPGYHPDEISVARDVLNARNPEIPSVTPVFWRRRAIDALRTPLSHMAYVERTQGQLHGIVQFFGIAQLHCRLGPATSDDRVAAAGVLDPVAGTELFQETLPLDLGTPPYPVTVDDYRVGVQSWLERFREDAVARGATFPPALQMKNIDFA